MSPKPSSYAEIVGAFLVVAAFSAGIYFSWRNGSYLAVAVMTPLTLLFMWGLADMLRHGIRRPTAFERFENRLLMRVVAIVFIGVLALVLLKMAGYSGLVAILLPILLVAILYSAGRLRTRTETSAGYKHRVGYRDPDQHKQEDSEKR
jgi:hypothetical protein